MARYHRSRDPYWLTAKFKGTCKCGETVAKGTPAWYWPSTRSIECKNCGEDSEARFMAELADEAFYNGRTL